MNRLAIGVCQAVFSLHSPAIVNIFRTVSCPVLPSVVSIKVRNV